MNSRRGVWWVVGVGLAISLLLAGAVSFYASSAPDGLDRVATDLGFSSTAQDSAAAGSPLAGYGLDGVSDERFSVGLAGVVGLAVTGLLAFGVFTWLARRSRRPGPAGRSPIGDAPTS